MKDKSDARKVIVLNEKIGSQSNHEQKSELLLPAIEFLENGGTDEGLFLLKDGAYRKVFQIEGLDLVQFQESYRAIEEQFKSIIDNSGCDIQIIVTSRPLAAVSAEKHKELFGCSENDYLKWLADYTSKWFWRVAKMHYLPSRRFYFVLTAATDASSKQNLSERKSFEEAESRCIQSLVSLGLKPLLLNREAVRALLANTFLAPAADSDSAEISDAPECLSPSSLMEPQAKVSSSEIKIADLVHGSGKISQFPSEIKPGWLANLVTITVPYTISIHIRQCEQELVKKHIRENASKKSNGAALKKVLDGTNRAVDISIYFASYGKTSEEVGENLQQLANCFGKDGAKISATPKEQIALWRSNLPLGIDEAQASHRLSSDIVSACWPAIRVVPEQNTGIPIGFGAASREILFVDPEQKTNFVAVGSQSENRTTFCTLLALRHLSLGWRVCYVGESDSMRFLSKLLGPDISEELKTSDLETKKIDSAKLLTTIDCQYTLSLQSSHYTTLSATLKAWSDGNKQIIFIEDGSTFLKTAHGTKALTKLIAQARLIRTRIMLATNPQYLSKAPLLWKFFPSQAIFPTKSPELESLRKYLHVPKSIDLSNEERFLSIEPNGICEARMLWSPMESGILLSSHLGKIQGKGFKERLDEFKNEVRKRNPDIPEVDCWRQAVYYFGMQKQL